MQFTLKIACDNAAFTDNPWEIADILRSLASKIEDGQNVDGLTLRDSNGNPVGKATFTED